MSPCLSGAPSPRGAGGAEPPARAAGACVRSEVRQVAAPLAAPDDRVFSARGAAARTGHRAVLARAIVEPIAGARAGARADADHAAIRRLWRGRHDPFSTDAGARAEAAAGAHCRLDAQRIPRGLQLVAIVDRREHRHIGVAVRRMIWAAIGGMPAACLHPSPTWLQPRSRSTRRRTAPATCRSRSPSRRRSCRSPAQPTPIMPDPSPSRHDHPGVGYGAAGHAAGHVGEHVLGAHPTTEEARDRDEMLGTS